MFPGPKKRSNLNFYKYHLLRLFRLSYFYHWGAEAGAGHVESAQLRSELPARFVFEKGW